MYSEHKLLWKIIARKVNCKIKQKYIILYDIHVIEFPDIDAKTIPTLKSSFSQTEKEK